MADDELRAAEAELEEQLAQHAEALQGVRDALRADQGNAQLIEAEGQLAAATSDIETTLLELKQERLLAEVSGDGVGGVAGDGAAADGPGLAVPQQTDAGGGGTMAPDGGPCTDIRIGGRYRFRFTDGHWHAGLVVALQHFQSSTGSAGPEAVVRFLHPTQRSMLGGVQLPASALQPHHDRPHDLTQLAPGDVAFAQLAAAMSRGSTDSPAAIAAAQQSDDAAARLWEEVRIVAFRHGGHSAAVEAVTAPARRANIAVDDLILSPWADDLILSPWADDSSASESDSDAASDDEAAEDAAEGGFGDGAPQGGLSRGSGSGGQHVESQQAEFQPAAPGIPHDGDAELDPVRLAEAEGARAAAAHAVAVAAAAAAGRQTDMATFAEWEANERGIGSRIMAAMGYVAGSGLGRGGSGIVAPIQVTALRPGAGLGVLPNNTAEGAAAAKKRRRGGKKARARKFAEAQRAHRHRSAAEADAGQPAPAGGGAQEDGQAAGDGRAPGAHGAAASRGRSHGAADCAKAGGCAVRAGSGKRCPRFGAGINPREGEAEAVGEVLTCGGTS